MARQGKYHSTPMHYESAQYKYAVEHEVDSRLLPQSIVSCDSLDKGRIKCTRWNSGFSKCESHRCLYFCKANWRQTTCEECAFFLDTICYHQNRPENKIVEYDEACFCYYFFPESKEQKQFQYIRNCCERFFLSKEVLACKKRITSKNKYIRQAALELNSSKTSGTDKDYLSNKIKQKTGEMRAQEELLKNYLLRLEQIGGLLEELPWSKKRQHSKPRG